MALWMPGQTASERFGVSQALLMLRESSGFALSFPRHGLFYTPDNEISEDTQQRRCQQRQKPALLLYEFLFLGQRDFAIPQESNFVLVFFQFPRFTVGQIEAAFQHVVTYFGQTSTQVVRCASQYSLLLLPGPASYNFQERGVSFQST